MVITSNSQKRCAPCRKKRNRERMTVYMRTPKARTYIRKWRADNADKVAAHLKKWKDANPERLKASRRESARRYRAKNSEAINAKRRAARWAARAAKIAAESMMD